jgi:hypothetical protein
MESDPVFQMGQNKMILIIPLGTTFQVEIPLHEHWLSTWPTTLQSRGLIWYAEESRMAGGFHAGVCRVRVRTKLYSDGAHMMF